jgi:hypothetical protein
MIRRGIARSARSAWLRRAALGVSALAFAASGHAWAAHAGQEAAASRAAAAARLSRTALNGTVRDRSRLMRQEVSLQGRLPALRAIYLSEADGGQGPGLSGMAGNGPEARQDLAVLSQFEATLRQARTESAAATAAARSLIATIRAQDSLSRSGRARACAPHY